MVIFLLLLLLHTLEFIFTEIQLMLLYFKRVDDKFVRFFFLDSYFKFAVDIASSIDVDYLPPSSNKYWINIEIMAQYFREKNIFFGYFSPANKWNEMKKKKQHINTKYFGHVKIGFLKWSHMIQVIIIIDREYSKNNT